MLTTAPIPEPLACVVTEEVVAERQGRSGIVPVGELSERETALVMDELA